MKLLVIDIEGDGMGLDISLRAQDAGHSVRYWLPSPGGNQPLYGRGLVERPLEWEPSMDWAELVLLTGNDKYHDRLAEYFGKGYPILGANPRAAELELDRGKGQEVLKRYGIETLPYKVVSSPEEAIAVICKEDRPFCMKPWGSCSDKAMTCVPDSVDAAVFTLLKWKKEGLFKGELMLQEKVSGIEMAVSGIFGPGGWNRALEESFEHKKFLTGDLGQNTGEMGTVLRHVNESKLFEKVLEPLTEYLHSCHYVGPVDVNCIIEESGTPWPLEFTMRFGWPDFCIRQPLIEGDPIEWMADLLYGRDTLRVSSDVAVGVVMTHGDFPVNNPSKYWAGFPLSGITDKLYPNLHLQEVMMGQSPRVIDGKVKEERTLQTAGTYVLIASGTGETVGAAQKAAYKVADSVRWSSNVMYRTDIGERLRKQLPLLQEHGYAVGMEF